MKKVLVVFIYLFIMSCSKNDDTQTLKVETYAITNNPTNIVYATYAGHGGFEECQGDGCKEAGACFLGWDIVLFESELEALNYSRNKDLAAVKLSLAEQGNRVVFSILQSSKTLEAKMAKYKGTAPFNQFSVNRDINLGESIARKLGKSSITIHCGKYPLTGKQNPNIAFAGIASVLATSN